PVLPKPNPSLLNSFGKQMQAEKKGLREASRLARLLRISGPLYDNLESPSDEDKLFGFVPEIDDSIRTWPEVATFYSKELWDLFYLRFFARKELIGIENKLAIGLIRQLKQHLLQCGNDPANFPHLKNKLRFVSTQDVPVDPL